MFKGGYLKVEYTNLVLHRQIGHTIAVMGRHKLDLTKAFSSSYRANRSLLAIDLE